MPSRDRILLVEDDRDAMSALFLALTRTGFSVITADDGAQAVDLLSHGVRPRLIILDLLLPKINGWEVLKYLREDPQLREVPVIVTTALDRAEAKASGADLVLHKPLKINELLDAVARLIDPLRLV